jgi:hypothetical protein
LVFLPPSSILLSASLVHKPSNPFFKILIPGALRICLSQRDIILQDPRTLCSVLSEDFTGATTESVFGDNGQLAREVDRSGFG